MTSTLLLARLGLRWFGRTFLRLGRNPQVWIVAVGLLLGQVSSLAADVAPGALPIGGQITAGTGSIAQNGNVLVIQQDSAKLVTNWAGFDIGSAATVQFHQPGADSIALNRVTGGNPSQILGSLDANGRVFLLNPAGIVFGKTANVNVGGLVASTLSLSDANFLAGRNTFTNSGAAGSIVNQGNITAAPGGVIALIAPVVRNEGTLAAPGGNVALAAGDQVDVDFAGDGRLRIRIDLSTVDAEVANHGLIKADGGAVVMSAKSASNLTRAVVNNTGIVEANTVASKNGRIVLESLGAGSVQNSGTLSAQGLAAGETGGAIVVTGERVGLMGSAIVDASGQAGGGTVNIGGGFQGKDATIANAQKTIVDTTAVIRANAGATGNGGSVVVWSDDTTRFHGAIEAMGGALAGNGGSVEVSGKGWLDFQGQVNTTAAQGQGGSLLLDPTNIVVATADPDPGVDVSRALATELDSAADNSAETSWITPATLVGLLDTANVAFQAYNDITFSDAVDASSNINNFGLTLTAGRSILINDNITLRGAFYAYANSTNWAGLNRGVGAGDFTMAPDTNIVSSAANAGIIISVGTQDPLGTATIERLDSTGISGVVLADISIIADSIDLRGGTNSIVSTRYLDLRPKTATRPILIGALGDGSQFSLTNTELAAVKAGALNCYIGTSGQTGGITLSGALSFKTRTILTNTGAGGAITLAGSAAVNTNGNAIMFYAGSGDAGTFTQASGATLDAKAGNITIKADSVVLNGDADSISGSSNIYLYPSTTSRPMIVGAAGSASDLALDTAEIATLKDGFADIWLGGTALTGGVTLSGPLTFHDNLNLQQAAGGSFTVNGTPTVSGQFRTWDAGPVALNASIAATGGVWFDGAVTVGADNLAVDAGTGTATFSSTVNHGANTFTVTADDIALSGNWTGTGARILQPTTVGQAINLAGATASFALSTTELGYLSNDSPSSVTIGRSGGTGAITGAAFSFNDPLNLRGGAITQSGDWTLGSTASFAAGAGDITLTQASNDFTGAVTIASGHNVSLTDTNALDLGASTVSGNLTVQTGGALTQSGDLAVTGTTSLTAGASDITLTRAANDFIGAVTIVSGNNVSLTDANSLLFGGASTFGGNLNVAAADFVQAAGATITGGAGAITITADTIALDGAADSISGTGLIYLYPVTLSRPIKLGATGGASDFALDATELATLKDGFLAINLGRANLTGGIDLSGAFSFKDNTFIDNRGVGGRITLAADAAVTTNGSQLYFLAGTGNSGAFIQNAGATIKSGAGYLQISADSIILGGAADSIQGTGILDLQPNTDTRPVILGAAGGAGDFALTTSEIATLKNGFSGIWLGADSNNGGITIASALAFHDSLLLFQNVAGGSYTVNATPTVAGILNFMRTAPVTLNASVAGSSGVTFSGAVTVGANGLTVDAGTGAATFSSTVTHGANNFTVTADDVALLGNWTGTGARILQPTTVGQPIGLADVTASFALSTVELGYLSNDSPSSVTIGRSGGTGAISGAAFSFDDPLVLRGGAITQSGAWTLGSTASFAAGAGDITLTRATNNFVGAVTVVSGNNVNLWDANSLLFRGASAVTGNLFLNAATFTQAAGATITTPTQSISITADSIDLQGASDSINAQWISLRPTTLSRPIVIAADGTASDFALSTAELATLHSANVYLGDMGSTGGLMIVNPFTLNGNLALYQAAGGSVTVNAQPTVSGALTFSATTPGAPVLLNASLTGLGGVTFYGPVTVGADNLMVDAGTGSAHFADTVAHGAHDFSVTADRVWLAKNWTGSGARLLQPTTTNCYIGLNDGSGFFSLDAAELGYLSNGSPSSVTIGRADGTGTINGSTFSFDDPLFLRGGSISQNGAWTLGSTASFAAGAGGIALTQASNDFTGAVTIVSGHNVSLRDTNALDLGASTVTGNLTLQTGGALTQSGDLAITGATSLTAGANDITLDRAGNDFGGAVSIVSGNNVSLRDTNALVFGASTLNRNLTLQTGGALTQSGALTVAGTTSITAGANDLTLDRVGNDFGGVVFIISAASITLRDANDLTLGTVTATGTVDIATLTGDLTLSDLIETDDDTAAAITLNAGTSAAAGTVTGGNIIGSGDGAITTGTGGFATLYTGSISGSTGLTTLIGSGTGRFRYNSDESTTNYSTALTAGLNAIYREQPILSVTPDSHAITYGDATPTFSPTIGTAYSNGDASAGTITGTAIWTIGGATSTAGHLVAGDHDVGYDSGLVSSLGYGFADNATSHNELAIAQKSLAVTGLTTADRAYNATAVATLGGTAAITKLGSDDVTLGGTASGTFADKNFGTGKAVTVTGNTITGDDAANYTLVQQPGLTADISKANLVVTGLTATNKIYDATNTATLGGTAAITKLGSDDVTLGGIATGTFADKNFGTGKAVTVVGNTISGTDAGNYTLVQQAGLTANIAKASVTLSTSAVTKTYDAGLTANGTAVVSAGSLFGTDSLSGGSFAFTDKNVGRGNKTVTVSGVTVSDGNAGNNYAVTYADNTTSTINPFTLIVDYTGVNRVYDATTGATVTTSDNRFGTDVLTINRTAAFITKDVANGKTVAITGVSLSGTDALNYTVATTGSTTADITPATLTVGYTGVNRVYDATTGATVTTSDNRFGSDVFTINRTAAFLSKDVANGKTVAITGVSLSGTNALNYTVAATGSATADITPATLTVGYTGVNRVYDATIGATVTTSDNRLGSDVLTINRTADFLTKDVANGKTVNVTGVSLSGTDAGNYTVAATGSTTADITPATLTVGYTGVNRLYDATTGATVMTSDNRFGTDELTINRTAAFTTKDVANGKTVAVTGVSLSGTDAGNYSVAATGSTTADVTPATLIVTGLSAANKIYDGTTSAVLDGSGTVTALGSDVVSLEGTATAAFVDKNVGTGKAVTVVGNTISGADAGNYTLVQQTGLSADITAKTLTITFTAGDKVYDGTMASTLTGSSFTGLVGTETVSATHTAAAFDNKNVGTAKTVTVSGIALSDGTNGGLAANYTIASTATTTAAITPATLTYVADPVEAYSPVALPVLSGAVTGFIGTDTLANATTGTAVWTSNITPSSFTGNYAINGSGLAATNYLFVQAAGNATALFLHPVNPTVTDTPRVEPFIRIDGRNLGEIYPFEGGSLGIERSALFAPLTIPAFEVIDRENTEDEPSAALPDAAAPVTNDRSATPPRSPSTERAAATPMATVTITGNEFPHAF